MTAAVATWQRDPKTSVDKLSPTSQPRRGIVAHEHICELLRDDTDREHRVRCTQTGASVQLVHPRWSEVIEYVPTLQVFASCDAVLAGLRRANLRSLHYPHIDQMLETSVFGSGQIRTTPIEEA
jgi:hypothetical protein